MSIARSRTKNSLERPRPFCPLILREFPHLFRTKLPRKDERQDAFEGNMRVGAQSLEPLGTDNILIIIVCVYLEEIEGTRSGVWFTFHRRLRLRPGLRYWSFWGGCCRCRYRRGRCRRCCRGGCCWNELLR